MALRNCDDLQVTDLLERMTPASARFDLQTSAFTDIIEQQNVLSQPGASSGIEPWYGLPMAQQIRGVPHLYVTDALAFIKRAGLHHFVQHHACFKCTCVP